MAVLVGQLQKEIRAARFAEQDSITKAWAWEEEVRAAQESLLGMRCDLQAVLMECGNLKAKSHALNNMVKAREVHMCTTVVDRLQSELATKKVRELAMKDACQRLRVEEWRLQNLATCLEHNAQLLLGFEGSIESKGKIDDSRWSDNTFCKLKHLQKQADEANLAEAHKEEKFAEMQARIAEAALAEVCRVQADHGQEALGSSREESKKSAEEGAILSLKKCISKVCGSCAEKTASVTSTQAIVASQEKLTEDEKNTADMLEKSLREDEIDLAFVRKQTYEMTLKAVAIEEAISGTHLEELRGMVRWRRLAVVSPIFGAWLVTAWWLVLGAFGSESSI
mmetsp:Transcript_88156/g.139352  ORF Transcript_88156/g.139352 Transcript_88156/m.139352 type:complete len:338 (-) Transcript_88156:210-1223(-)